MALKKTSQHLAQFLSFLDKQLLKTDQICIFYTDVREALSICCCLAEKNDREH